jgi:hypothetical protein
MGSVKAGDFVEVLAGTISDGNATSVIGTVTDVSQDGVAVDLGDDVRIGGEQHVTVPNGQVRLMVASAKKGKSVLATPATGGKARRLNTAPEPGATLEAPAPSASAVDAASPSSSAFDEFVWNGVVRPLDSMLSWRHPLHTITFLVLVTVAIDSVRPVADGFVCRAVDTTLVSLVGGPSLLPGSAVAGSGQSAVDAGTPRARLTRFFAKYVNSRAAANVDTIDGLLKKNKGREEAMFKSLVKKHGAEPPAPVVGNSATADAGGERWCGNIALFSRTAALLTLLTSVHFVDAVDAPVRSARQRLAGFWRLNRFTVCIHAALVLWYTLAGILNSGGWAADGQEGHVADAVRWTTANLTPSGNIHDYMLLQAAIAVVISFLTVRGKE